MLSLLILTTVCLAQDAIQAEEVNMVETSVRRNLGESQQDFEPEGEWTTCDCSSCHVGATHLDNKFCEVHYGSWVACPAANAPIAWQDIALGNQYQSCDHRGVNGCCNRKCCGTSGPKPLFEPEGEWTTCDCSCHVGATHLDNKFCEIHYGSPRVACPDSLTANAAIAWQHIALGIQSQSCDHRGVNGCCNRKCCYESGPKPYQEAPSPNPTTSPTTYPSDPPSTSPSANPSTSPSSHPSESPSTSPSTNPSSSPSGSPSGSPSSSPSASPSSSPSNSPSASPSTSPSVHPSASPSSHPGESPSASPSSSPTSHPSQSPSSSPSSSPSGQPTSSPSAIPSTSPSGSPSANPSSSPSGSPSQTPTAAPSEAPEATSSPEDCAGEPNGDAVEDECGVCGGDDSSCEDCAGDPNGDAVEDECGVCGGDDSSCEDCAGEPNGDAVEDECGVCGGDDSSCEDCAGEPNGDAVEDECGVCGGDDSSCESPVKELKTLCDNDTLSKRSWGIARHSSLKEMRDQCENYAYLRSVRHLRAKLKRGFKKVNSQHWNRFCKNVNRIDSLFGDNC